MTDQRPQYENRSRLGLATPAIRPGMKGRVLLGGPSGAGKTYTALLLAMVLRERIDIASVLQIDTEKDSGLTYADDFQLADGSPAYKHLTWGAPYNAVDLAMTLRDASGKYDVVIVDSHTHFWKGQGGVLDVAGGRWTGWAEARPMQVDMVDAILSCDAHVILCARMTQEHEQTRNVTSGKLEVVKLGMKIQQDADLEYEVNVALELDMNHILRVTKSRTRAVPVGREYIAGHAEEFAGQYREWLAGGEPAASKEQIDNLVATLNRIADPANRMLSKQRFVETFGRPEMLLVSRLHDAAEWVANAVLGNEPPADRAPDEEPPQPSPGDASDAASAPVAESSTPAQGDQETPTDENQSPSPDTEAQTGQADDAGDQTGYCATCGVPAWSDAGGMWRHAENDTPTDHDVTPAGPDVDVDALYAAWVAAHPPASSEMVALAATIEAEVDAMSPAKVLDALRAASLSIQGTPKTCRKRYLTHRLRTEIPELAPANAG